MRLDAKALGLAAGLAAAILYVVCAIAVALAPDATTTMAGFLIHADLGDFGRTLTWGNFVGGLLGWGVGTGLVFWLVATFYNRLSRSRA
jgi:hypothetical protein